MDIQTNMLIVECKQNYKKRGKSVFDSSNQLFWQLSNIYSEQITFKWIKCTLLKPITFAFELNEIYKIRLKWFN